jgi:hypothetical protein
LFTPLNVCLLNCRTGRQENLFSIREQDCSAEQKGYDPIRLLALLKILPAFEIAALFYNHEEIIRVSTLAFGVGHPGPGFPFGY